jgi:hypothetical protein
MMKKLTPKYPIFVPSLGRAVNCLTAKMFVKDNVPFHFVVQPDQVKAYADVWGIERILVLPENGKGLVYARNWIKDYSVAQGDERHWQWDDDIRHIERIYHGHRLPVASNIALAICESFVDRYENVALASLNSTFFVVCNGTTISQWPPFYLNQRCYTCFLVMNSLPNRWRYRYNEDTDMSLQVLADGWCTILFNAFLIQTNTTMTSKGGQTDIYINDGRLRMARELERVWPGVVSVSRRFNRPQHMIEGVWKKFDNKLIKKKGLKIEPGINEFGMKLKVKQPVQSKELKQLLKRNQNAKN